MPTILTVNAGSSSIRIDLREAEAIRSLESLYATVSDPDHGATLRAFLHRYPYITPSLVAHRIVHGGPRWTRPVEIDHEVLRGLEGLMPWAPLHLPAALAWLKGAREVLPGARQVAVFDTGFFADLPAVASTYAIPRALAARLGIRRYGFHGIAHAAMWRRWSQLHAGEGRVITLQLGAGCSAAAILDGRPLDTSMGFTPTEGLVMATRPGDLDPGLLVYLQREERLDPDAMGRMLNQECGLLGLSGTTADMRELCASGDATAALAVDVFTYRVRKYLGAYLAVLGGLDGIVFGGGIGEHSPRIRAACLAGLAGLGIELDPAANEAALGGDARISPPGARVAVHTVVVDEAGELARAAWDHVRHEAGE
jgi:acetate kinase